MCIAQLVQQQKDTTEMKSDNSTYDWLLAIANYCDCCHYHNNCSDFIDESKQRSSYIPENGKRQEVASWLCYVIP